jgi:hypothetical protein
MNGFDGFLNVKGPGLSLGVAAIPVEETKGGIAGLLDFRQQHPSTDGMDRAGRKKNAISGPWLEGVQAVGDRAGFESGSKSGFVHTGPQAGVNLAPGSGIQNEPGLGLASFSRPEFLNRLFIGVDLDGKPILAIEKFHQPGEPIILLGRSAQQFGSVFLHELVEGAPGPGTSRHHAQVQRMIANGPGLAKTLSGV